MARRHRQQAESSDIAQQDHPGLGQVSPDLVVSVRGSGDIGEVFRRGFYLSAYNDEVPSSIVQCNIRQIDASAGSTFPGVYPDIRRKPKILQDWDQQGTNGRIKGCLARRRGLRKRLNLGSIGMKGAVQISHVRYTLLGQAGIGQLTTDCGPVVLFPDHLFQFFTGKAALLQYRKQCPFCKFVVEGDDRSVMVLL
jgi:hypothetical protein